MVRTTIQIVRVYDGDEQHVRKLTVYADSKEVLEAVERLIEAQGWRQPEKRPPNKSADRPT